jgi:hypothetical protein
MVFMDLYSLAARASNVKAHPPPETGATKRGTSEVAQAVGGRVQRLVRLLDPTGEVAAQSRCPKPQAKIVVVIKW